MRQVVLLVSMAAASIGSCFTAVQNKVRLSGRCS